MPVMLKGPTGCGKSRFVEYMAWKLGKPLITVACNEDMTASDLIGRFLLDINGTKWQDGPLTIAARIGAICYLDEVVEARQDTTVVIHPLTDHSRQLPLEKEGRDHRRASGFPGRDLLQPRLPVDDEGPQAVDQAALRRHDLRLSRSAEIESEIVAHESGIDRKDRRASWCRSPSVRAISRATGWMKACRRAC
jgi:nitric oxide reductase NorQ protein